MATVLTILGLLLTAVGLIALRPQLSVTTGEPLTKSEAFSVPFRITNSGLTSLTNIRPIFYLHQVKIGGLTVSKGTLRNGDFESTTLDRGETKTIVCNLAAGMGIPKTADITVVVDYQLSWVPFASFRRYFRFIGQYGDSWQWLAQPSKDIQEDADFAVKDANEQRDRLRQQLHVK